MHDNSNPKPTTKPKKIKAPKLFKKKTFDYNKIVEVNIHKNPNPLAPCSCALCLSLKAGVIDPNLNMGYSGNINLPNTNVQSNASSSSGTSLPYGNTTQPYSSTNYATNPNLADYTLKSNPELLEILVNLNPHKGNLTYLLATFVNEKYQIPFGKALLLSSELSALESNLTSEIMLTLLQDGFLGTLAELLATSKNLSK